MKSGAVQVLLASISQPSSPGGGGAGAAAGLHREQEGRGEDWNATVLRERVKEVVAHEVPRKVLAEFTKNLPSPDEVNELNGCLGAQTRMNYQDFLRSSQLVSPSLRQRYFLASTFDKFSKDRDGCVDVEEFLKYVQRSVDVERVQLELATHSSSFNTISEQELEQFVLSSMTHTPLITDISPPLAASFVPFYVFTAVRRFLFFLDPKRTCSVNIHKLAHSAEMDEFLWLQRLHQYRDDYESEDCFQQQVAGNWFSVNNAIEIYNQYIQLDEDGDGMLSESELLHYHGSYRNQGIGIGGNGVQLTPTVISRIFQENITYQPADKMDYKTFLDLSIALENRECWQSLRYFWRAINIYNDDMLHPATVDYFFKDIRQMLLERGYDSCPQLADVRTEVMDMLGSDKNADTSGDNLEPVSFAQMVTSGQASTVIAMLIDIHKFWAYDNRETLSANNTGHDDDDDDADDESTGSGAPNVSDRTIPQSQSSSSQTLLSLTHEPLDLDDPYDFS